eukprot:TRINITY_DN15094_c0_g1_i1.p1 TRINITY_DN15094_c0_g1~~TRINITY_DN15094_c0_g1_i1.p1  ORF type:complete len:258 (-),score=28.56 TRINITY_DN15094_c0_g1_i1:20-793(-)
MFLQRLIKPLPNKQLKFFPSPLSRSKLTPNLQTRLSSLIFSFKSQTLSHRTFCTEIPFSETERYKRDRNAIRDLKIDKQYNEAIEIYLKLRKANTFCEQKLYHMMIEIYGKIGDIETMLSLYEEMKAAGIRPTLRTFNILINELGSAEKYDKMKETFDKMINEYQIKPDVITFHSMVKSYGIRGMVDEMLEVFENSKNFFSPDESMCRSVLVGLNKAGRHDLRQKIHKEIKEKYFPLIKDKTLRGVMVTAYDPHSLY